MFYAGITLNVSNWIVVFQLLKCKWNAPLVGWLPLSDTGLTASITGVRKSAMPLDFLFACLFYHLLYSSMVEPPVEPVNRIEIDEKNLLWNTLK